MSPFYPRHSIYTPDEIVREDLAEELGVDPEDLDDLDDLDDVCDDLHEDDLDEDDDFDAVAYRYRRDW